MKIKCRKCLLSEVGEAELIKSLEELIQAIPETERCDNKQYTERLSICKECDKLNKGMCVICGCYVEFRALKSIGYCPDIVKKW